MAPPQGLPGAPAGRTVDARTRIFQRNRPAPLGRYARAMDGAEALLRTARAAGLELCLANPGTTEMPLVAALDRVAGLRSVLGLFEGVCTGAADGYGRMTGRPALTLLHLGPGLANGLANLHNARRAHTPIVNLVGDHASWHLAADAPLASDIASLAETVGFVHTAKSCGRPRRGRRRHDRGGAHASGPGRDPHRARGLPVGRRGGARAPAPGTRADTRRRCRPRRRPRGAPQRRAGAPPPRRAGPGRARAAQCRGDRRGVGGADRLRLLRRPHGARRRDPGGGAAALLPRAGERLPRGLRPPDPRRERASRRVLRLPRRGTAS